MTVRFLALCLAISASAEVAAQPMHALVSDSLGTAESLDVRLLRSIYNADGPVMTNVMGGADVTAYPVILAAVPVTYGVARAQGATTRPAVRMGLSGGIAAAAALALKRVVGRERPFTAVTGIVSRSSTHQIESSLDPNSFPSGHATLAFALATSASLSEPTWYVIAPAMTWASAVAFSRVWQGVHYPSDVLAGAALGAGSAVLIHILLPDGETGEALVVSGTIRF